MQPYPQTGGGIMAPPGTGNKPSGPRLQEWRRGYMASLKLASWPLRFAAGAIDYLPLALLVSIFSAAHVAGVGWFFAIVALCANNVYMQGMTGQSLGKRVVGIRLVTAVNSGPTQFDLVYPGIGCCLGRQLAHIIDTLVLYLGWLRPLWERQYRTWADTIAHTVVLDRQEVGVKIGHRQPGQATTMGL